MDHHTDVVAEALKTPTVYALYKQIDRESPITFEGVVEGDNWQSKTVDGNTTIYPAATKHAAAALTHELLHAKLKLGGYLQYLTMVSMDTKRPLLKFVGEMLDNELQHHRMFEEFLAAGFRPEQFYHDDDVTAFPGVRRELKALKKKKNALPEEFLRLFVTVIAPGGIGTDNDRGKLKTFFSTCCPAATWGMLCGIEEAFADWRALPTFDAGDTIIRVLRLLGGYEQTWIGTSVEDFPGQGKFVGDAFTEEDAIAWHNEQAKKPI